jgi:hypothetical protein
MNDTAAAHRDKYLTAGLQQFRRKLGRNPRTGKLLAEQTIFATKGKKLDGRTYSEFPARNSIQAPSLADRRRLVNNLAAA